MATELFADFYKWTVTLGGTDAPTAGTSETFTVASATGIPAAVAGLLQFRIVDIADTNSPPEIMVVTNVSGTTLTVTRGAEGPTAPWTHLSNWVAVPVVTASSLYQGLRPYVARTTARGAFR